MEKIIIILDAAHGEDTPGKRSPDGRFREYRWSREIILDLSIQLKKLGYKVFESNPSVSEIGLSKRAANANKIEGLNKIFISIHANAAGNGATWMNARGFSVYTTKGKTRSDLVAETIMSQLIIDFPELKSRPDKSDGDLDQEEDFTVIKKTNCPSVLIEWNFQDNKEDVDILLSSEYNSKFIKSLIKSINTLNDVLTQ